MRAIYGIILIIFILQQLSWGFTLDPEYSLKDYNNHNQEQQQEYTHGTFDKDYEDRAGNEPDNNPQTNDDNVNRRNPQNLRGLG